MRARIDNLVRETLANRSFVILVGLAVTLLAAAVTVFVMLVRHESDVRNSIREDALWATYQLDREVGKLLRAIDEMRHIGGPERLAVLGQRYDILYSRMDLLKKGDYPAALSAGTDFVDGVKAVRDTVFGSMPLFDSFAAGRSPTADELDRLESAFESLQRSTEAMVTSANGKLSGLRTENRIQSLEFYQILGTLVVAIMLTMSGVIAILVRQIAEAARTRRRLEAMTHDLVAAAEAAQAGNRAKSAFLATMSHEIRTPMNGVLGMADALGDTRLTEEQRGHVETIRACGLTLVELINDVLDFSKLEAGSFDVESRAFDPIAAAETAIRIVEPRARERGLTVILAPETAPGARYLGDEARLRQVLVNLLSNAIKFTETGCVVVRIRPAETVAAAGGLHIEVQDTGIGISEAGRERLFKEFSQVDASITRRFGGTGLGLAICKRIVETLGGSIGLDSVEGEGTTFRFDLPFPRQPDAAAAASVIAGRWVSVEARSVLEAQSLRAALAHCGATPVSDPAIADMAIRIETLSHADPRAVVTFDCRSGGSRSRMVCPKNDHALTPSLFRQLAETPSDATEGAGPNPSVAAPAVAPMDILLVEDNRVNQEVARRLLVKLGHRVTVAENGAEALAMANTRPFDLILMDMMMPVMDGLEATRAIRKSSRRGREIPIVAMTANAFTSDREACLAAGMNEFLSKPIERGSVAAVLARFSRSREEDQPAAVTPGAAAATASADPEGAVSEKRMRTILDELGADGLDFLMTTFAEDASACLSSYSAALAAGDVETARRALHTIKGSAANVGFSRIASIAARLMKADGDPDLALVSQLVLEIAGAEAEGKAVLARVAAGTGLAA